MHDFIRRLIKFTTDKTFDPATAVGLTSGINQFIDSFSLQYAPDSGKAPYIRISELGNTTLLDFALRKYGVVKPDKSTYVDKQLMFWYGCVTEAWCHTVLPEMDYTVLSSQEEVTVHGVKGHYDFKCVDNVSGEKFLLEVKSTSDSIFNYVKKQGVHNSYGWITQLGMYAMATKLPAYWLFINRVNGKCHVEEYDPLLGASRVDRAISVIAALNSLKSWKDAYKFPRVVPTPEVYKKQLSLDAQGTPLLMVPSYVKYPQFHYIMHTGVDKYGKDKRYATDWYTPEGVKPPATSIYEAALQESRFS